MEEYQNKGNPLNMNYSDSQFRDFLTNPFQNLIIDLSNATLLEVIESLTTVKKNKLHTTGTLRQPLRTVLQADFFEEV